MTDRKDTNSSDSSSELCDTISSLNVSESRAEKEEEGESTWKNQYIENYGNPNVYIALLKKAGCGGKLEAEFIPQNGWKSAFLTRSERDGESGSTTNENELKEADEHFQLAEALIKSTREKPENILQILEQAASHLIQVLILIPDHAHSFHYLAFMCFLLNSLEEAMTFIEFCEEVNPEFEPVKELKKAVESLLEKQAETNDHAALLDEGELSEYLENALTEIFDRFDKDGDNALSRAELDAYVFYTNGQHVSDQLVDWFRRMFECTPAGFLTLSGFLDFYLRQTLTDPDETWKDLRKHGFDEQLTAEDSAKTA